MFHEKNVIIVKKIAVLYVKDYTVSDVICSLKVAPKTMPLTCRVLKMKQFYSVKL